MRIASRAALLAGFLLLLPPRGIAAPTPRKKVSKRKPKPKKKPAKRQHRLKWKAHWGKFTALDYIATSLTAASAIGLEFLPINKKPRWADRNKFDEAARTALRMRSVRWRERADLVSDMMLGILVAYPTLIDTALITLAIDQNPKLAWKMFLINVQAFTVIAAATSIVKHLAARTRPYVRLCGPDSVEALCRETDPHLSFLSGHTSFSFMGAGLICVHSTNLELYGSSAAGWAACSVALAAASLTGILRVMADRHYMSDVLAGAVTGFAVGYLMPALIYYRIHQRGPKRRAPRAGLGWYGVPIVSARGGGVAIGGIF